MNTRVLPQVQIWHLWPPLSDPWNDPKQTPWNWACWSLTSDPRAEWQWPGTTHTHTQIYTDEGTIITGCYHRLSKVQWHRDDMNVVRKSWALTVNIPRAPQCSSGNGWVLMLQIMSMGCLDKRWNQDSVRAKRSSVCCSGCKKISPVLQFFFYK